MRLTGDNFTALCADLDAAIAELIAATERDPALWERGRPGKWTAGRHAAHVGIVLARTAGEFEQAEQRFRAGTLPPPSARRGFLQSLFLNFVVEKGHMPRGGKATPWSVPPERPDREGTLAALRRDAERHRRLGERLSPGERERLWIPNPFIASWHYRLPEMVRMHAVHARHHRKLIDEIAPGR
jgi:hypothetical protein